MVTHICFQSVQVYWSTTFFFIITLLLHLFYTRSNIVPFPLAGKGEDKEYPTIGARMIRLEDKVGTLLVLSLRVFCLQAEEIKWLDQLMRLLSWVWLQTGCLCVTSEGTCWNLLIWSCFDSPAVTNMKRAPALSVCRISICSVLQWVCSLFSKPGMCRAVDFPCHAVLFPVTLCKSLVTVFMFPSGSFRIA